MKTTLKTLSKDIVSSFMETLNFDLISISYLNETADKKSPRLILNNYKILLMLQGQAGIYMGKNVYYTQKGDCVIFSPGSLYHAEILGDDDCQFISINFDLASITQQKIFNDTLAIKDVAIYPKIISELGIGYTKTVLEEAIRGAEGHYFNVLLVLQRLLGSVIYNNQKNILHSDMKLATASEEKLVMQCHAYIINNPQQAVTVEELCNICNVSQSYLYKCFKSVLGTSCKEFITHTKIQMAARALLQTNKSVSQIAVENGFSNGYQFSNIFKKVNGLSPSAYRKIDR